MTNRYWTFGSGRERARYLRGVIDELWIASTANGIEHRLRNAGVDVRSETSIRSALGSLINSDDLTYGARGWASLDHSILAGYRRDADADRHVNEAIEIFSRHPDRSLELRFAGAMLDASIWQAAIRQRNGPVSAARESVDRSRHLIAGSGARHLSMRLAFREVAIHLELDPTPDEAHERLSDWNVDLGWESTAWWLLAHALLLIWNEAEPHVALARMDHAAQVAAVGTGISPDRHALGIAAQLCAVFVSLADEPSTSVAERCHRLLDAVLALRSDEPIGPMTEALMSVTEAVLSICADRADLDMADIALRAVDESRRAGIETVVLQPPAALEATREQFSKLVQRFHRATGASTAFARFGDSRHLTPEAAQDVRSDLAALFPRFSELSAPTRCEPERIRSSLGPRVLLHVAKVRPLGDDTDTWYLVSAFDGRTQVSQIHIDDEDLQAIDALGGEDETWELWWLEFAHRLLPANVLDRITTGRRDAPIDLVVVPDGELQRLPWAALRIEPSRPLVRFATVNVLPSVRLLTDPPADYVAQRAIAASWDPLAGDSTLEKAGWGVLAGQYTPHSIDSAQHLVDLLHPEGVPNLALIHMRGHGRRQRSGLAQSIDLPDAQRLSAIDAVTLRWPPVVTMSACHVARPEEVDPSDPGRADTFGLTMACIVGGASEVLGGQHMIDDQATGEIMQRLFTLMAGKGLSGLPRLLRQAQIEVLDRRLEVGGTLHAHQWAFLQATSRR